MRWGTWTETSRGRTLAEERLVEEMRLLGREALQGWADERVEVTERDVRGQAGMHRQGKKNSAGTRNSARA